MPPRGPTKAELEQQAERLAQEKEAMQAQVAAQAAQMAAIQGTYTPTMCSVYSRELSQRKWSACARH
jgi:uncharacterized protein YhaN